MKLLLIGTIALICCLYTIQQAEAQRLQHQKLADDADQVKHLSLEADQPHFYRRLQNNLTHTLPVDKSSENLTHTLAEANLVDYS